MKKITLALGILILLIPVSVALGEEPMPTPIVEDEPTPDKIIKTPRFIPTNTPTPVIPTEVMITTTPTPFDITITPTSTSTATPSTPLFEVCEVNLVENTHTCSEVDSVRIVVPPDGGQAVVEVDLDPTKNNHTRVAFELHYDETPQGMTLNIGDSSTNDGYGGDARTQSNDAEIQVVDAMLSVYGNDYMILGERDMLNLPHFVNHASVNLIEVRDQRLDWAFDGAAGYLSSWFLFALNGQVDWEGPSNYKIYAGFNRSIYRTDRNGTGLGLVVIFLLH
jgi:hypothetical protein